MDVGKNVRGHTKPVLVGLLVVIMALVPLAANNYYLSTLVVIGLNTMVVVGLGLLMGYAGQISLGHAAFFGLGAYASAIIATRYHVPPILGIILAAVVTGLVAYLIGRPTLKLKEHFLALATLGFGIIIHIIFNEGGEFTGGPSGLTGIPYLGEGVFPLDNDFKFYYLVWVFTGLTMLFAHNLVNSRVGRALRAIHGSEVAAETLGVDTAKYKLQIFVVSAVIASLAGSLYAHYVTFISPSPFGFKTSVELVLMAVIGGLTSIWGPLLGASLVVVLTEALKVVIPMIIPNAGGEFEIIVFGVILVVVMIFLPNGLTSMPGVIRDKLEARKEATWALGEELPGELAVNPRPAELAPSLSTDLEVK